MKYPIKAVGHRYVQTQSGDIVYIPKGAEYYRLTASFRKGRSVTLMANRIEGDFPTEEERDQAAMAFCQAIMSGGIRNDHVR